MGQQSFLQLNYSTNITRAVAGPHPKSPSAKALPEGCFADFRKLRKSCKGRASRTRICARVRQHWEMALRAPRCRFCALWGFASPPHPHESAGRFTPIFKRKGFAGFSTSRTNGDELVESGSGTTVKLVPNCVLVLKPSWHSTYASQKHEQASTGPQAIAPWCGRASRVDCGKLRSTLLAVLWRSRPSHTQVCHFFHFFTSTLAKMKIFLSTAFWRVLGRFLPVLLAFVNFK